VTIVNVTHDQREALMLSDRIGILEGGKVLQVATPETLYRAPETPFVAEFMGDPILIRGTLRRAEGRRWLERGDLRLAVVDGDQEGPGVLVLRSESVTLLPGGATAEGYDNQLAAQVELAAFEGTGMYYEVTLTGHGITAKVLAPGGTRGGPLAPGDSAVLAWNAADAPVLADGE
jgi:ABC-type Fe3+/spermidine/putrescine transport system ATPase subunit